MLRQFGGLCTGVCLALAGAAIVRAGGSFPMVSRGWLVAALTVGLVTMLRPGSLRLIFVGWMIVAFPIGWVVGKLALAAMFFGLFTAVGLVFRMMGRDPMGRHKRVGTYWTARDQSTTPADYLRQY